MKSLKDRVACIRKRQNYVKGSLFELSDVQEEIIKTVDAIEVLIHSTLGGITRESRMLEWLEKNDGKYRSSDEWRDALVKFVCDDLD